MVATFIVIAIVGGILTFSAGYFIRKYVGEVRIGSAEEEAQKIRANALKEAENKKKEALVEAKDEVFSMRTEAEKEIREWRTEIQKLEKRLSQREELLDNKSQELDKGEKVLAEREGKTKRMEKELQTIYEKEKKQLENLAGLSAMDARKLLLKRMEEEVRHEAAVMIREIENQAREDAEKRARNIISLAIQRCATDQVAETTVSVVSLPNEDMKGRIIGREGRNIRALETLTGINLIIDDTPEAVILSGFDPVRREIAKLTLEKLIADGRIQPARIEETFEKTKKEVEAEIRKAGEQAAFDTDVRGLHSELLRVIGRLNYRTSYGQNVLQHSTEVAHLAGIMAAEVGADVKLTKRAGILHDIGKAIDHEVEGPHALIGADLAKRLRESPAICHIIEAHHEEVEPRSLEAVLVQAADAISGGRPGARRETLESYIKRLEELESLAQTHPGVEKTYAVQAGREIRVMVKPEEIDDVEAVALARDIAKKIEGKLEYPGQIKVIVIRENRAVAYAK